MGLPARLKTQVIYVRAFLSEDEFGAVTYGAPTRRKVAAEEKSKVVKDRNGRDVVTGYQLLDDTPAGIGWSDRVYLDGEDTDDTTTAGHVVLMRARSQLGSHRHWEIWIS